MLTGDRIAVLGGGVAGLTLALACARRGARVEVFEQAEALGEVGAGIQLSANGVRVLHALGLHPGDEIRANRPEYLQVSDLSTGLGLMRARQNGPRNGPHLQVHRADLIDWLAQAATDAGVRLHLGAALSAGDLAEAGFDRLARATGVRTPGRPGRRPRFTGQVAWRALVPAAVAPAFAAGDTRVFIGPGRHLVIYPLRGGEIINVVAVEDGQDWQGEGWHHRADPDALRARFAGACAPVSRLLDGISEARRWALFTHADVTMLDRDGLPLVGDAAQTMLPFMAQGAVMALEDAWTLARAWDAGAGLAGWSADRAGRRRAVARVAQSNGRIFHARNPLWLPFHRAGMWGLGRIWPGLIEARAAWIYDHDVTAQTDSAAHRPEGDHGLS